MGRVAELTEALRKFIEDEKDQKVGQLGIIKDENDDYWFVDNYRPEDNSYGLIISSTGTLNSKDPFEGKKYLVDKEESVAKIMTDSGEQLVELKISEEAGIGNLLAFLMDNEIPFEEVEIEDEQG